MRLHPDDAERCVAEEEVEFEVVKFPTGFTTDQQQWQEMSPTEKEDFSYHRYAKIITSVPKQETWADINRVHKLGFSDYLVTYMNTHYHPPVRK